MKLALRTLAARIASFDTEIKELERSLTTLVRAVDPTLLSRIDIGTVQAEQLLVTAGENVDSTAKQHLRGCVGSPQCQCLLASATRGDCTEAGSESEPCTVYDRGGQTPL